METHNACFVLATADASLPATFRPTLLKAFANSSTEPDTRHKPVRIGLLDTVDTLEAAAMRVRTHTPYAVFLDQRILAGREFSEESLEQFGDVPTIVLVEKGSEEPWLSAVFDVLPRLQTPISSVRRVLRNLKDRQQLERAVKRCEKRFALVAEGSFDGLWDWNLAEKQLYLSPRCQWMLGYDGKQPVMVSDRVLARIHPNDAAMFWNRLQSLQQMDKPFECEFRLRHRNGTYRWVRTRGVAERTGNGKPVRIAGSLTDITKTKLIEDQLLHDAFHDVLTGLPNRVVLVDLLERALARKWRNKTSQFAVLTLDLDRFKVINDSIGPCDGDRLLVAVARRLRACVRPADTVVRLGGDEFAILLENVTGPGDALRVAERIHAEFEQPVDFQHSELFATFSIGVALGSSNHHRADEVLRDADTAMHWAKERGRARTEVFNQAMRANAVHLMRLDTDLRRAVARNEFYLQYQPIVCLRTGHIVAFEALARWNHPVHGEISPTEFIPLAEENGLILPLGEWVLHEACRQTRDWQRRFPQRQPLSISVNLSNRQFRQQNLVRQIDQICADTSIQRGSLRLEITESVMIDNSDATTHIMKELNRRQIQLHVDDFGTGYSSLSTLPVFPVDTLKIDRSFVRHVDSEHASAEIVRTIVALARNLELSITAEGVETSAQAAIVRDLQCGHGQGYFFSPPLHRQAAEQMLAAQYCRSAAS